MKTKKACVFILVSMLIIISCSNRKDQDLPVLNKIKTEKEDVLKIDFPDTVDVNKSIHGKLEYNLPLNSKELLDLSSRYVFLHIITGQNEGVSLAEIKKMNSLVYEDTIGNGKFKFDTRFLKVGKSLLNGVIEDILIFKTPDENGKTRIRTKETFITKDVYVLDGLPLLDDKEER